MVSVVQVRTLVPIPQRLGYPEARAAVHDRGGLPPHALLDKVLVELWPRLSPGEQERLRAYCPAWAKEVLVHPVVGGKFRKGEDVVDASLDSAGRAWVFPGTDIPEAASGKPKIGLFVDPQDAVVEKYHGKDAVIIHPASIITVEGLVETPGGCGQVHEATRLPIEVAPEILESLSEDQKRWLYRIAGPGVRSFVRIAYGFDFRRLVGAYLRHDIDFGVAYVRTETAEVLQPALHFWN